MNKLFSVSACPISDKATRELHHRTLSAHYSLTVAPHPQIGVKQIFISRSRHVVLQQNQTCPTLLGRYKKMWAFAGMGFIISVGYMDPGNWATDITAGSSFGYVLLIAVLLASITAMFLQVRPFSLTFDAYIRSCSPDVLMHTRASIRGDPSSEHGVMKYT